MRTWMVSLALGLAAGSPLMAEAPKALTLERIFASPSLNGTTPVDVQLSPDGKWLTSIRPRADDKDRYDLWGVDTRTGTERMLVDSLKLGSGKALSEAEKMQRERARIGNLKGIVHYDWAPDGKSLLVPLDGDLFITTLDGTATKLPHAGAGALNPSISPKGRYVAFVRDQNLVVVDRASGAATALTTDGKDTLSWGLAEFVAQEEMDRSQGYWWSPDDERLAVARVDESGVEVVTRAAIGAEGTTLFNQRYPRAGTNNAKVELHVIASDGTSRIKVDLGSNADIYLARVAWAPDGKTLYVQRESRDQKTLDLLAVDPDTGASRVVLSETSQTWLHLQDDFRPLKDGSFLWQSERDGYAHLYHYLKGIAHQLTSGAWMVKRVAGVDEAHGTVFFLANRDDTAGQDLYSVSLKGGAVSRLTEAGWWNDAVMDKTATRAIISRSGPNQPAQSYLADAGGKRIQWITENRVEGTHPYAPYLAAHITPTFGTIKAADGSVLHYKLIRPADDKPHPVIVQVYNGPGAGRQALKSWDGPLHQYMVQHGWVVFSIDGRGSPDRGVAFERQIYHAMGRVEVTDQLAGVAWLKAQKFVDPKRVAVFGWSYGGYMTLKLLEAAPGTFAAGVSVAPVTKWELYDTHYTERYLGDPRTVPEVYTQSDALTNAEAISDPLLLVHGMADDNVVFENSTALLAKLQAKSVPFETMVYPGQTHSLSGPGVSLHLWRTVLAYLDRTVKNKEK